MERLQEAVKVFRPIEVEKCLVCGKEYDKLTMQEVFTGRTQYICSKCRSNGNRLIDARQKEWRSSSRGKAVIKHYEKNK